jgi:hypothetical protein
LSSMAFFQVHSRLSHLHIGIEGGAFALVRARRNEPPLLAIPFEFGFS